MNQSSLTDRDRDTLQRAAELASLNGADEVRQWAGSTTYDVSSTLSAYVELAGAAQALLGDLSDIVRRLGIPIAGDAKAAAVWCHACGEADHVTADCPYRTREDDGAEDETYHCATCGATIGHFIGHGDGWHHYRGSGTLDDPTEIYDAGHPATLTGLLP